MCFIIIINFISYKSECATHKSKLKHAGNKAFIADDDFEDENESSIRRACSLSDLSMGKGNLLKTKFR